MLLCLCACGGKATGGAAADTVQADTDSIYGVEMEEISPEQTVSYYYSEVVKRYMEEHVTNQNAFLDFCSADFKRTCLLVAKKKRINHDAGPVDFDMWINAKIFDNLSIKNIDRYPTDDGAILVEITLRNTGQENKVFVELVNENGLWMIDDFRYPDDKGKVENLKPLLNKYLEEN